jgi:hypothetical protein
MKEFSFRAPTLFDATAKVPVEDELHDAPAAAEAAAKIKKFAVLPKAEMVNAGLAAKGPYLDEGGWCIDVPSDGKPGERPFVLCIASGNSRDPSLLELLVTEIGGAPKDVADAIERILRHAKEISELKVD